MNTTKISFIVPCYNLAHLLPDCINSILQQSYSNFEVLIMDDCSPDNTQEVSKSFNDNRIKYIRNETNLGHLQNYNKGISLAAGKYVWLISADDCLRKPYVLERFVTLLEENNNVGYVFCPSVHLEEGREEEIMKYTAPSNNDIIFNGLTFLQEKLILGNFIPAPAALARKECYEKISFFPLDLPYSGDWYLWCLFAFYYDVGFLAEPMVYRRFHPQNITKHFFSEAIRTFLINEVAVPWRIKQRAEQSGYLGLVAQCEESIIDRYFQAIINGENGNLMFKISDDDFEYSLRHFNMGTEKEHKIRSLVHAQLGDYYYSNGDNVRSYKHYRSSLKAQPFSLSIYTKYLLCRSGYMGSVIRKFILEKKNYELISTK